MSGFLNPCSALAFSWNVLIIACYSPWHKQVAYLRTLRQGVTAITTATLPKKVSGFLPTVHLQHLIKQVFKGPSCLNRGLNRKRYTIQLIYLQASLKGVKGHQQVAVLKG